METEIDLQALRETEMEITDVIDRICRRNHLCYSLSFGTLLGVVRHGGFIPWDDDIDLMMPREDYEKLLEIWKKEAPPGYILQNKRTNWDFTQNFTKIRKDHTTFLQGESERTATYHTGIFVDIFPVDRVAPTKIARKKQIFLSAVNLLYSRGFTSKSGGIRELFEHILLALPMRFRKWAYRKSEKAIGQWNSDREAKWYVADIIEDVFRVFEPNLFDEITDMKFEDREYQCVRDTDGYLKVQYGDYMQLPPEEKRVYKHNHVIISLDKNLSEIKDLK